MDDDKEKKIKREAPGDKDKPLPGIKPVAEDATGDGIKVPEVWEAGMDEADKTGRDDFFDEFGYYPDEEEEPKEGE